MKHESVESHVVTSVGYDVATKTLEVTFKNGRTYGYPDISADVHKEFMAAKSKGTFFGANIRHKFPGKLNGTR